MRIVAGIPAWDEPAQLIEGARRSCLALDSAFYFVGGLRPLNGGFGNFESEGAMRDYGRRLAYATRATWYLQLDADERLIHGELLRPILAHWRLEAYPLPYVLEDGTVTLAPCKLIRADAAIAAHCDFIRLPSAPARILCLSGYQAPPQLRDALLELPHLVHEPWRRDELGAGKRRLSRDELLLEPRPAADQWPLPPLTLERSLAHV